MVGEITKISLPKLAIQIFKYYRTSVLPTTKKWMVPRDFYDHLTAHAPTPAIMIQQGIRVTSMMFEVIKKHMLRVDGTLDTASIRSMNQVFVLLQRLLVIKKGGNSTD